MEILILCYHPECSGVQNPLLGGLQSSFTLFFQTLLMDEHRFRDLKEKTQWLILVSSVLLITYNTVGASIAGISSLKSQLKQHTADIIAGIPSQ